MLYRLNKIPKKEILLAPPFITKDDQQSIVNVLTSGQLSLGPILEKFEEKFARWIGTKYAVATSSGTTGLHLAIRVANIKENDEVITTPFSFIASSNCILYEKAKPIFIDIDPDTLNINVNKIEKAITEKTKAILAVHIFGYPADLEPLYNLAKKYNLTVIEDAAQAIGATYKGKKVGSWGNMTIFAFYPNKQMTTAEGGMITTNDKKQYLILKSLLNQGRDNNKEWLNHRFLGYNYRMSELHAALGLSQLKKLNYFLKNRQQVSDYYEHFLKNVPRISLLKKNDKQKVRSWFVYIIKLNKNISRKAVIQKLFRKGIPSRVYLPPIHLQPFYKEKFGYKAGDFPICEKISEKTLALPFYTGMEEQTVKFICKNIIKIVKSLS